MGELVAEIGAIQPALSKLKTTKAGYIPLLSFALSRVAAVIWRRLDAHLTRFALPVATEIAGRISAAKTAKIAMTTRSSTKVKAMRPGGTGRKILGKRSRPRLRFPNEDRRSPQTGKRWKNILLVGVFKVPWCKPARRSASPRIPKSISCRKICLEIMGRNKFSS